MNDEANSYAKEIVDSFPKYPVILNAPQLTQSVRISKCFDNLDFLVTRIHELTSEANPDLVISVVNRNDASGEHTFDLIMNAQ